MYSIAASLRLEFLSSSLQIISGNQVTPLFIPRVFNTGGPNPLSEHRVAVASTAPALQEMAVAKTEEADAQARPGIHLEMIFPLESLAFPGERMDLAERIYFFFYRSS